MNRIACALLRIYGSTCFTNVLGALSAGSEAAALDPLAKLARDVLQDSRTMPATYLDVLDYFHFWPSRDLAIVALSLFLFASLTVLAMTIYTRSWCAVRYINLNTKCSKVATTCRKDMAMAESDVHAGIW